MTRTRRGALLSGLGDWAVPALDALVEGAWIAVVEAAFAATGQTAALGPIPFAIAAGASLYLTRNAVDRTTTMVGLGVLYVAAFLIGGLIGGPLSTAVGADGQPAVFAQGAAVLMAVAVFRGSRHSEMIDDDVVNGSLLQWGFPVLAIPWLYASSLAPAQRDVFVATAFPSTLLFAAAGLLAVGLARLEALSVLSGVKWRSNRAWFVLLVGVLAAMVAIAIPTAFLLGTPLVAIAVGLLGPLAFVLGPIGAVFEKFIEVVFFLLTPLTDFLQAPVRSHPQQQPPTAGAPGSLVPPDVPPGEPSTLSLVVLGGIGLLIAVGIFLLVLRLTYRPRLVGPVGRETPLEEREFRLPSFRLRRPQLGRSRAQARPTTASAAYVAFLADLERAPELARHPDEPPATHAARLRAAGFADPRASLLAADYGLEHYALRTLSSRETGRALRRWAALRRAITALPRRPEGPPETPPA